MHRDGAGNVGIDTVEHLVEHLADFVAPPLVIVCVGNELCGDDGAGVAVARELAGVVPWQVYNTQSVPESFLMKIVEAKPASVILIDALDFYAQPGAIEFVSADQIGGQGPSTHGPAPLAFLDVLQMLHPCRCAVLGIQPQNGEFGQPICEVVKAAAERVVRAFNILATRSAKQSRASHY